MQYFKTDKVMDLISSLKWRYATKKYSERKVSKDKVEAIVEAVNLSPSSIGIQPYRLVVVEDPELRRELGSDSFNSQIATASHLLVFAAYTAITPEVIDSYMRLMAEQRGVAMDSLADFRAKISGYLLSRSDEENFNWASRQAYIGLGTAIVAAASLQVDATPMEGFNPDRFDELLGLKAKGLRSVVLLSLGYRDEVHDDFARLKKVRLPKDQFVTEIG